MKHDLRIIEAKENGKITRFRFATAPNGENVVFVYFIADSGKEICKVLSMPEFYGVFAYCDIMISKII